MGWDIKLIALYYWVDNCFINGGFKHGLRHSNNLEKMTIAFSDEEAMTVYINGILRKYNEVKDIYNYTKDHLLDWFPNLPSYAKKGFLIKKCECIKS